jgi:hypothetical protein
MVFQLVQHNINTKHGNYDVRTSISLAREKETLNMKATLESFTVVPEYHSDLLFQLFSVLFLFVLWCC